MLSIIIPTLNEEKYLPRLLASIRAQSFFDYEIIVSDGGSLDKTNQIALENNCVFITDTEHHHPAWQRNNGAAMARGDILLFLDADSVLPENFLDESLKEFAALGLVGAAFYIRFNPDKARYHIYSTLFNIFSWLRQYFSPVGAGAAILAKKSGHEAIKGFDVGIYVAEDFDYCNRLATQGKFRMINSSRILFSARRLEKEGEFKLCLKWFSMGIFTLLNIKIKKKIVKYDFGKY